MFLIFVVRNATLTVYSLNSAQLFAVSQAEGLNLMQQLRALVSILNQSGPTVSKGNMCFSSLPGN